MTISEQNIVKRWNIIASRDLGIDRNVEASAFAELFRQVFEEERQSIDSQYMKYAKPIIRGFSINEGLEDEISVTECLGLDYIHITKYGAQELDWYLMNRLGWFDRYQYALSH